MANGMTAVDTRALYGSNDDVFRPDVGAAVVTKRPKRPKIPTPEFRCNLTADQPFNPKKERKEVVDFASLMRKEVRNVVDEVERSLMEDREEGRLSGEVCSPEAAVVVCKRLATYLVRWLVPSSGINWAVFGENEGVVSLVLSSDDSGRRVDFRISPDGGQVSAISIDEDFSTDSVPLKLSDSNSIREKAAWVNLRP